MNRKKDGSPSRPEKMKDVAFPKPEDATSFSLKSSITNYLSNVGKSIIGDLKDCTFWRQLGLGTVINEMATGSISSMVSQFVTYLI